jgi:arsenate reductase
MIEIYHNPRCSKSRQTLDLLKQNGHDPVVVEYLKDVPSASQLKEILSLLGIKAEQLLRKGEAVYKEQYKGKNLSEDQWIAAMVLNPKLIERPIVISGGKARIGRPPELVLEIV